MSSHEDTLALIASLSAHIATTLAALKRPSPPSSSSPPPPPLSAIRNDLLIHLDAANKAITAASLALKPPAAVDAAHASLDKLPPTLEQLRFALEQLPATGTLARKLNWAAQESLEALSHFLACTSALLRAPAEKKARDAQLVATKGFWSALERAGALPADECAAEREKWKEVLQLLDDCADEVRALGESAGAEGEDEDEAEDDDDEEEREPLTQEERHRAAAALQLVRLARLLLAHLHARTAPPSPAVHAWSAPAFVARASERAAQLSEKGDDLAGCLEPGQDGEEVEEAAGELCDEAEELARAMEGALEEAEGGEEEGKEAREKEREWLAMWRKQRDAARDKLAAIV
ncbi:hypothetical protein JCM10449v2_007829 [Rhodotorula kratochvilovae]